MPSALTAATGFHSDYPELLDAAWSAHLAPREPGAPTVISLFAGCGGSSLGYSMAGYRELLAVEWDDNAVETFAMNFPGVPVFHGDIADLTVERALEMAGIRPGDLDVLDGSPPCQGFTTLLRFLPVHVRESDGQLLCLHIGVNGKFHLQPSGWFVVAATNR